jgi:hypothetical protein
MTADAVKEILNAIPFVPFVLHLPDRPAMRVPHPDFAHVSPKRKTMVVYRENGEGFSVIDVALITEIAPRTEPPRKRKR